MYWLANDISRVLWFAVAPAIIAVLLIVVGVDESEGKHLRQGFCSPIQRDALKQFSGDFGRVVAVGAVFALARCSEAFLVLRAQQAGLAVTWIPLVMVVMSVVYSVSALPAGLLSDRIGRRSLLVAGLMLLILADLILAWAGSPLLVLLGVALWGLHMGFTQGILAAMVADVTPAELKGTAFGLFNLASGFFMLLASVMAGGLWERYGAAFTFCAGGALSLVALAMLVWFGCERHAVKAASSGLERNNHG